MSSENYPSSTVVSILPYEIRESKPNLYPGNFTIPAGSILKPGLLKVTHSRFYIPMAFGAPAMAAHSPAYEVARSIVNDYVTSLLGANEDCRPGIFVVDRIFSSVREAASELIAELPAILEAQRKWFFSLVNTADAEFNQYHQNPQVVSDLQRMAARELNLKNKPWLQDFTQLSLNNCPACYTSVNDKAVICPNCRYVLNADKYKSMQFAVEVVNTPSNSQKTA